MREAMEMEDALAGGEVKPENSRAASPFVASDLALGLPRRDDVDATPPIVESASATPLPGPVAVPGPTAVDAPAPVPPPAIIVAPPLARPDPASPAADTETGIEPHEPPGDETQPLSGAEAAALARAAASASAAGENLALAPLAIAFAAAGLEIGGGFMAARGEPVPGAILYVAGAATTLLAALLLVDAARARRGFTLALATLAVLGAVALGVALVVVGAAT